MSLTSESDSCGKIDDALAADPDGLHAGFAVALARSTNSCHTQPHSADYAPLIRPTRAARLYRAASGGPQS